MLILCVFAIFVCVFSVVLDALSLRYVYVAFCFSLVILMCVSFMCCSGAECYACFALRLCFFWCMLNLFVALCTLIFAGALFSNNRASWMKAKATALAPLRGREREPPAIVRRVSPCRERGVDGSAR